MGIAQQIGFGFLGALIAIVVLTVSYWLVKAAWRYYF